MGVQYDPDDETSIFSAKQQRNKKGRIVLPPEEVSQCFKPQNLCCSIQPCAATTHADAIVMHTDACTANKLHDIHWTDASSRPHLQQ